jgi:microcystin-dependent protein
MAEEQQDALRPFPYVGQIVRLGFPFTPIGWLLCEGQKLPKDQYPELFDLIGTTYGGDATNFALPDLRSGVPIGAAPAYPLGQRGGGVFVTLTPDQLPQHRHLVKVRTRSTPSRAKAQAASPWFTPTRPMTPPPTWLRSTDFRSPPAMVNRTKIASRSCRSYTPSKSSGRPSRTNRSSVR